MYIVVPRAKKKKKEKDSVIGVTKLDNASGVTGQSDGPGIIVCRY